MSHIRCDPFHAFKENAEAGEKQKNDRFSKNMARISYE